MMIGKTMAVLITCHNRRDKTLSSLKALYEAKLPDDQVFEVYLVDDGSTDGTKEAVNKEFPQIHVISGDGSLFWNQGMRLAWQTASENRDYDFYLLLNDDTILKEYALIELFQCYRKALIQEDRPSIFTGACQTSIYLEEFSYGGRNESGPVVPNGKLQQCKYTNGNVLLIPNEIYLKLGNLSPDYTHGMGDYDYGLRVQLAGFKCYTTETYIAICPDDTKKPGWSNSNVPLSTRWKLMHSPKGLNLSEYNKFRKNFWGWKWIIYAIKAYLKVLFPEVYSKLSSKKSF
ncbi:glycosyltransferase family 2 protein [Sunxiuqinia sp. A32]|uniref:glycosyltransferase family 2 protein n=1 Tax=Sunxiuqinia sp. A32 TaxID=3461496 RepID=UPI0040465E52